MSSETFLNGLATGLAFPSEYIKPVKPVKIKRP